VIDPATPTTLYAGAWGGGVFKSTNGGANWSAFNSGLTDTDVQALAIDPTTPTTLYAGTWGGGVFKSTNGGANWSEVNTGLTAAYVAALAIDPATPTTLYAGTQGGGVFQSTDGGGNWSEANTGLPGLSVDDLAIDPTTVTTVYVAMSGGVFRSANGGGNWSAANTGLPGSSVNDLAIDPATPTTLYAGTYAGGVFKSTNSGGNWSEANTGLTHMKVGALAIDPATPTTLYAGTQGGGVFDMQQEQMHRIYLPLVLRNHDANRSTLSDPSGDWLPGAVQLASTDILGATAERRPAEGAMVFTMRLYGDLPEALPAQQRNRWAWLLDTDMNAGSGEPWYDIGAEYEVNLHVQWDGFYVDVRDWNNNWTPVPGAGTIDGSTVTVRIPVGYLGGATRFDWMVVVEPFARAGTRFDIAPNGGHASLP
jgi:photosystem II stability/assembly factor-like uncharacterized protein